MKSPWLFPAFSVQHLFTSCCCSACMAVCPVPVRSTCFSIFVAKVIDRRARTCLFDTIQDVIFGGSWPQTSFLFPFHNMCSRESEYSRPHGQQYLHFAHVNKGGGWGWGGGGGWGRVGKKYPQRPEVETNWFMQVRTTKMLHNTGTGENWKGIVQFGEGLERCSRQQHGNNHVNHFPLYSRRTDSTW